jgi:hypothetical protein
MADMRKLLPIVLASCAATQPAPHGPSFDGQATESWLAYQVDQVGRDDLLPAFEVSADRHGCFIERLGNERAANIGGLRYSYHGVSASCREGTIAIITLVGGGVRIGCARPTTREDCDLLLRKISEER